MQSFVGAEPHNYRLEHQSVEWLSLTGDFAADLGAGQSIVDEWYPQLAAMGRTTRPLAELFLAQQCGGSDAFSGISANPLLVRRRIRLFSRGPAIFGMG
jgi:altronate dehydratase